jgi:hypothetical protein
MGILVWSAQVKDLLGKSSLWVTGKGQVPGTGFVGLGLSVPNICLGPTGNLQGSHKFMSLTTGKRIVRCKFTEMPLTNSVKK